MLGTGTARVQEWIFDFINPKKKKKGKFEKFEKFEKHDFYKGAILTKVGSTGRGL